MSSLAWPTMGQSEFDPERLRYLAPQKSAITVLA